LTTQHLKQNKKKKVSLIRRYNKHGALVLQSKLNEKSEPEDFVVHHERLQKEVFLEDLDEQSTFDGTPLKIQDHKRYFEGHSHNAKAKNDKIPSGELMRRYEEDLKKYGKTKPLTISADIASNILTEITKASTGLAIGTIISDISLSESKSEKLRKNLDSAYTTANELLRHFWTSYPISSAESGKKVQRVITSIQKFKEKLQETAKEQRMDPQQATQWNKLIEPILHSIEMVIITVASDVKK